MKKILTLLLVLLLLTGCKITKLADEYDKNINNILTASKGLANVTGRGYKYYLPRGVRLEKEAGYNKILYSNSNLYFLYIDVISYYHDIEKEYQFNNDAYYSRVLDVNNKQGYVEINKLDDKYLIEMMYNYSKIEAIVTKEALNKTLIDISYILTNIKFNDKILDTIIGEDVLNFNEERFDIFEPTRKGKDFLDYVEKYDNYEGLDEDIPSSDEIELNDDYYNY